MLHPHPPDAHPPPRPLRLQIPTRATAHCTAPPRGPTCAPKYVVSEQISAGEVLQLEVFGDARRHSAFAGAGRPHDHGAQQPRGRAHGRRERRGGRGRRGFGLAARSRDSAAPGRLAALHVGGRSAQALPEVRRQPPGPPLPRPARLQRPPLGYPELPHHRPQPLGHACEPLGRRAATCAPRTSSPPTCFCLLPSAVPPHPLYAPPPPGHTHPAEACSSTPGWPPSSSDSTLRPVSAPPCPGEQTAPRACFLENCAPLSIPSCRSARWLPDTILPYHTPNIFAPLAPQSRQVLSCPVPAG